MKKVLLALAAVFMSGCASVVSLNPLYSGDRDVVQDLPVEGAWTDGDDIWVVRQDGAGYSILGKDGVRVKAHMLALAGARYLDVEPVDPPPLTTAVHMIVKVWMEQDHLCAAVVDSDWLRAQLEAALPAQTVERGDTLILTAPTAVARGVVERFGADPRALGETTTLERMR